MTTIRSRGGKSPQQQQRDNAGQPHDAHDDSDPVQVALRDGRTAESRRHAAAEKIRHPAPPALMDQDGQREQEAGDDENDRQNQNRRRHRERHQKSHSYSVAHPALGQKHRLSSCLRQDLRLSSCQRQDLRLAPRTGNHVRTMTEILPTAG